MTGVVHPHDTLGAGELADHVGHQIALGEQAGTLGLSHVGADALGDKAGDGLDALNLGLDGAELLLEQHGLEARQAGGQGLLEVGLEEELGVRETGANHLLVAADDLARVFRLDVGDEDELRQQLAVLVVDREVLLVTLHGVHQRFSRHGQELLFEVGGQHHRPLDQCGDLFQQGVIQIGHATEGGSGRFGVSLDLGLARHKVGNHFAFFQQDLRVLAGVVDGEFTLAHKAVTANGAGRVDTQNVSGHQIPIQQQGHGEHRTHELDGLVAPAHHLGNGQLGQCSSDQLAQQFFGRTAFDLGGVNQPLTLVGDQTLGLFNRDAVATGPAFGSLGRLAFGIERLGDGRAALLDALARLLAGQLTHFQRQTAR